MPRSSFAVSHGSPPAGPESPWRTRLLLGAIISLPGLFNILLFLGIIPWVPSGHCHAIFCDPDHWQIFALGLAFTCAGFAFVIPRGMRRLGTLNSLLLLFSLLAGLVGTFLAR